MRRGRCSPSRWLTCEEGVNHCEEGVNHCEGGGGMRQPTAPSASRAQPRSEATCEGRGVKGGV